MAPRAEPELIHMLRQRHQEAADSMYQAGRAFKQALAEAEQYYIDYYRTRDPSRTVKDMQLHIRLRAQAMASEPLNLWRGARAVFVGTGAMLHAWDSAATFDMQRNALFELLDSAEQARDGKRGAREALAEARDRDVARHYLHAAQKLFAADPLYAIAPQLDSDRPAAITRRKALMGGLTPFLFGPPAGAVIGRAIAPNNRKELGMGLGAPAGFAVGMVTSWLQGSNHGLPKREFDQVVDLLAAHADDYRDSYVRHARAHAEKALENLWDDFEEWRGDYTYASREWPQHRSADAPHQQQTSWQRIEKGLQQVRELQRHLHSDYPDAVAQGAMRVWQALDQVDAACQQALADIGQWGREKGLHADAIAHHQRGFGILHKSIQNARDGLVQVQGATQPLRVLAESRRQR